MLPIQTLHRHSDSVNAMVINGDLVLSGSEDTEIKVRNVIRSGSSLHLFCFVTICLHHLGRIAPASFNFEPGSNLNLNLVQA